MWFTLPLFPSIIDSVWVDDKSAARKCPVALLPRFFLIVCSCGFAIAANSMHNAKDSFAQQERFEIVKFI